MLVWSGALVFLTSCATNPQFHYTADGPKFREEDAANLIIRHLSDDTNFLLRPDGHDGQFLRIYSREGACAVAAKNPGERGLALVLINSFRIAEVEQQTKQKWVESLSRLHYQRIVFLRANDRGNINGLRIVSDTMARNSIAGPMNGNLASIAAPAARHP
jgi:hypothetical protein